MFQPPREEMMGQGSAIHRRLDIAIARADEDEDNASSGASDRAPRSSTQPMMCCDTPKVECCHINNCQVLLQG